MRTFSSGKRLLVIAVASFGMVMLAAPNAEAKKKSNGSSRVTCCSTLGNYHPRLERTSSKTERYFTGVAYRAGN